MFIYILSGQDGISIEQAEAFSRKIPESRFSPAEIMNYLQGYREAPVDAVEDCG